MSTTIAQMIEWLEALKKRHGPTVPVYFDCPHCGYVHQPGKVETTLTMTAKPAKSRAKGR